LASLRKLHAEPQRVTQLVERARLFRKLAGERGLNVGEAFDTPVVPVLLGRSLLALRLTQTLAERGINVSPILYPAVPEHEARLRLFITVDHTPQQIATAVASIADALAAVNAQCKAGPRGQSA
jgi:7-keto-8-aminopelargonate synthetase-like enzyme